MLNTYEIVFSFSENISFRISAAYDEANHQKKDKQAGKSKIWQDPVYNRNV